MPSLKPLIKPIPQNFEVHNGRWLDSRWRRSGSDRASIDDAVKKARSLIPSGKSLTHCEECGAAIPEARQKAAPGVRLCVACQPELDEELKKTSGGINRRGSKDSQLR